MFLEWIDDPVSRLLILNIITSQETWYLIYQHPQVIVGTPKYRTAKCGVVYDIQYPECDQHYIGETARTLATRIKEPLSCCQPLSAIHRPSVFYEGR